MPPPLTLGDDVTWDGRAVVGDRVQNLLAVLVSHAPEVVSEDRLIEELWGAELPANPAMALHVVVSRARAMTDRGVVERATAGYRLGVASTEVDLLRLAALAHDSAARLAEGDVSGAVIQAREALDIPLAATADSSTLDELRRNSRRHLDSARRTLALALATQGEHAVALPLLASAVADASDDEELLTALLTAEAATMGPAAALTRYEAYRTGLADRLGTDPGPRLRRLHQQLLDADHPVRQGIRYAGTELLGRTDDIRALSALTRTARVTSIVGAGGLGKTRLAHVIGATAVQSVVHFVELVGVTAPEDVVGEVGSVLGVRDSVVGRRALTTTQRADVLCQIAQQLDRTPTLLILDNCEHVVEAAADLVAQLVATCRDVHVLTTSRAPLGIAAEHVYALGELDAKDASDLFRLRARAARPGVALHPDAVRAVVDRLDGLPLAIELAAAKVRAMSVEDIERRLSDRFALLRGRDRSAPDRHQTLVAVIDWSWNLLGAPERTALARLSVFHDGFTLEAAEAVVGPDALASIEVLADQSLVVVRDLDDGTRYRMLETVRDFGRMKLADTGGEPEALTAQRDWAVRLAKREGALLYGPKQVEAIDALRGEEMNLADVLHRCLAGRDPEGVVALVSGLGGFWTIRGDHPRLFTIADAVEAALVDWTPPAELEELTRTALVVLVTNSTVVGVDTPASLDLLRGLGPGDEPSFTRAAVRLLLEVYGGTDDVDDLSERLGVLGQDDDPLTASLALQWRSHLLENSGDPQGALDAASAALAIATAGRSSAAMGPWGEAMLNTQLAQMNAQFGRFALAAEHAERAAPVLERLGAVDDLLQSRALMAMAALEDGRIDDAERILDSFLRYQGNSLFGGGVVTGAARAEVALARGDTTLALQLYDELAVELDGLRVPGIPSAAGLEPWVVFGQAIALTAHARHGTAEGARPFADAVRHKLTALLTGPARMLDLPVLGIGFFGLGVWGLRCGTVDPAQATRLLVVADTLAYSRLVPSLAWETAMTEAQDIAPGAVHVWQAQYAGRTARGLVPDALGALEDAGLAGPAERAPDTSGPRQKH